MKKLFLIFLIMAALATITKAQSKEPYSFAAPADWRSERINFPLDFAPDIKYQGFEELRFAPGMFNPKADSYFTYAFFWWLAGKPEIKQESLAQDLKKYFRGLCATVGASRKLSLDLDKIEAKVMVIDEIKSSHTQPAYRAIVTTYDPFNAGQELTLNIDVTQWYCAATNHTCVFFLASPQTQSTEIWQQLRTIHNSFKCD